MWNEELWTSCKFFKTSLRLIFLYLPLFRPLLKKAKINLTYWLPYSLKHVFLCYHAGFCIMLRQPWNKEQCGSQVLCSPASDQLCPPAGEDWPEAASCQLAERKPPAGQRRHHYIRIQQQEQTLLQVQPNEKQCCNIWQLLLQITCDTATIWRKRLPGENHSVVINFLVYFSQLWDGLWLHWLCWGWCWRGFRLRGLWSF